MNARDVEAELREGEALFDARLAALRGLVPPTDQRRAHIEALVEHGATEGERSAARAALERIDADQERRLQDQQDEDEYLDALYHGAV